MNQHYVLCHNHYFYFGSMQQLLSPHNFLDFFKKKQKIKNLEKLFIFYSSSENIYFYKGKFKPIIESIE